MPHVYESQHPLVKHKLTRLRDPQTHPVEFREMVEEIAMLLAYEATQDIRTTPVHVRTPLNVEAEGVEVADRIGLVPILRAGLGMVSAFLNLMPIAQVWHLGLYRDEETLAPVAYYNKLPPRATVDVAIILDPMLATGGSASAAATVLKEWGVERIKFVGLLAAPEGIAHLHAEHPDVSIYVAHIDDHLTPEPQTPNDPPRGFIVPGLGDAGDRLFGTGQ